MWANRSLLSLFVRKRINNSFLALSLSLSLSLSLPEIQLIKNKQGVFIFTVLNVLADKKKW